MEEQLLNMIDRLRQRAETEVPETGEFKNVYEKIENPNKRIDLTDIKLRIAKPPQNIEGHERTRYLELAAYRFPEPYVAERVVAFGSKQDILKALSDDNLVSILMEKVKKLEEDLNF